MEFWPQIYSESMDCQAIINFVKRIAPFLFYAKKRKIRTASCSRLSAVWGLGFAVNRAKKIKSPAPVQKTRTRSAKTAISPISHIYRFLKTGIQCLATNSLVWFGPSKTGGLHDFFQYPANCARTFLLRNSKVPGQQAKSDKIEFSPRDEEGAI